MRSLGKDIRIDKSNIGDNLRESDIIKREVEENIGVKEKEHKNGKKEE